jgi:hypothetical protein
VWLDGCESADGNLPAAFGMESLTPEQIQIKPNYWVGRNKWVFIGFKGRKIWNVLDTKKHTNFMGHTPTMDAGWATGRSRFVSLFFATGRSVGYAKNALSEDEEARLSGAFEGLKVYGCDKITFDGENP